MRQNDASRRQVSTRWRVTEAAKASPRQLRSDQQQEDDGASRRRNINPTDDQPDQDNTKQPVSKPNEGVALQERRVRQALHPHGRVKQQWAVNEFKVLVRSLAC